MRMALAPYPSYRWVAAFILVGLVLTPAVCIKDHAAASNRSPAIAQVGAKDRLKFNGCGCFIQPRSPVQRAPYRRSLRQAAAQL